MIELFTGIRYDIMGLHQRYSNCGTRTVNETRAVDGRKGRSSTRVYKDDLYVVKCS